MKLAKLSSYKAAMGIMRARKTLKPEEETRDHDAYARLYSEQKVEYADSKFLRVGEEEVHYLEALPAEGEAPDVAVVCVHDFGALCSSYRNGEKES
ncbi:hypothetical protein GUITHDRAFT_105579 [Guillardia theta CCMP2712]|uniref:Uncharacterized protein n=1 Tax=Guillardia theta (strain CCMP2712) TaxID=905079 RepID=L1JIW5_GUITC|nr:hypothetical protein GUITHDRAFT_105579 [Guillardia theta CCMP2712]EKX48431.1 hypothetical protein GUITHDRAFT_105579 [Guillardia theta CCMP2712]|eukprot:XP_005835411.1 hypothetical protein GUITHDRAFT_105579 [Guillardia theta CCMP2712]